MIPVQYHLRYLADIQKMSIRCRLDIGLLTSISFQNMFIFTTSGPEVIKLFSCSIQISMKFVLLINLKLLITADSFLLNIAEHTKISANKYENANYCLHFHICSRENFMLS